MALRSFIVFTFLLISACAFSQPFEGGFVRNEAGTKNEEGYYFWKDGEFSWFKLRGNERALGRGKYVVQHDSILLNFGDAQREFDLQAQVPVAHGQSRSIVAVNALHSSGAPFPGLKFALKQSKTGGKTDQAGVSRITIENPPKKDNIHFELDGYRTIDIAIELLGNDLFFAVVVDDAIRYRENIVLRFKLRRTKRTLVLATSNGTTTFRKVSRKKFLDRYHRA